MVDRSDSEWLRGFCDRLTDRRTFAILESLSRLKMDKPELSRVNDVVRIPDGTGEESVPMTLVQ